MNRRALRTQPGAAAALWPAAAYAPAEVQRARLLLPTT
jgi:hypothetical protein